VGSRSHRRGKEDRDHTAVFPGGGVPGAANRPGKRRPGPVDFPASSGSRRRRPPGPARCTCLAAGRFRPRGAAGLGQGPGPDLPRLLGGGNRGQCRAYGPWIVAHGGGPADPGGSPAGSSGPRCVTGDGKRNAGLAWVAGPALGGRRGERGGAGDGRAAGRARVAHRGPRAGVRGPLGPSAVQATAVAARGAVREARPKGRAWTVAVGRFRRFPAATIGAWNRTRPHRDHPRTDEEWRRRTLPPRTGTRSCAGPGHGSRRRSPASYTHSKDGTGFYRCWRPAGRRAVRLDPPSSSPGNGAWPSFSTARDGGTDALEAGPREPLARPWFRVEVRCRRAAAPNLGQRVSTTAPGPRPGKRYLHELRLALRPSTSARRKTACRLPAR